MEDVTKYKTIIAGLSTLIDKISERLDAYKDDNIEFAQIVYEEGLGDMFEKGGFFKSYEQYFRVNITSLEDKIRHLKKLKEKMELKSLLLFEPCRMN